MQLRACHPVAPPAVRLDGSLGLGTPRSAAGNRGRWNTSLVGIASVFVLERDFDSASRAFDAARNRTHDSGELKSFAAAIDDLATIKVR